MLASSCFASETSQSSHQKHPLVENARKYLGIRYRYGGSSPSRGFDCSGFVYYLLSRHGIRAPHSAAALFRIGKPISKSELKPGDLVFFKNTARRRGITHVGIYIGNGKFIHASSGRGRVTITSLRDSYYAARFVGARRLPLRKK
ncbi:MAG: C40 family peptidase [Armatimonadetes bacterium]|nr:C40 family peptidase [Armatimonadota bacterium]